MKLPNGQNAVVPKEKVVQYLLNLGHPVGGSKARFFIAFGFSAGAWEILATELKRHGLENEVQVEAITIYGTRYELHGPITAPDGTVLNVLTSWYIDGGSDVPRLVTAYPLPKIKNEGA
jgi:hypothetical protein